MSFSVDTIDLTMTSPDTGEYLTANVYYVDGVQDASGNPRPLSIGQLVMALCLQRASALEARIITMMDQMNEASDLLTVLTDVEKTILNEFQTTTAPHAWKLTEVTVDGYNLWTFLHDQGVVNDQQVFVRNDKVVTVADILLDDCISGIESKMDDKNSFNQQTMIQLQSLTNKRDQSYDMISNVLKSLGTVMTGIVNNT
ncbi:MAG: hypothetical protein IK066_08945 [Kiritimatiellae bacterium]|nr:hypothetical protein [Kiritimatiellia bacterium]